MHLCDADDIVRAKNICIMEQKDVLLAPSHIAEKAELIAKNNDVLAFRSQKVVHVKGEHGTIKLRRRAIVSTVQVEQFKEQVVKAFD
ncbi:MAG: hypothetical protein D6711_10185 [Chloroflexi bacterium]|nr:MAG: hypothetical protein D6711_10185 [Chloroflexota bacterium]